jgi:hypothetical protein
VRSLGPKVGPQGKLALLARPKLAVSLREEGQGWLPVALRLFVPESLAVGRAPLDTYTRRKEGPNGWTS